MSSLKKLPVELVNKIFEYDDTYKQKNDAVVKEINRNFWSVVIQPHRISSGWSSYKGRWFLQTAYPFHFEENCVFEYMICPFDELGEEVDEWLESLTIPEDDDADEEWDTSDDDDDDAVYYLQMEEQYDDFVYASM